VAHDWPIGATRRGRGSRSAYLCTRTGDDTFAVVAPDGSDAGVHASATAAAQDGAGYASNVNGYDFWKVVAADSDAPADVDSDDDDDDDSDDDAS
jgi:hypothetical protein